jgi:hypothetical protein
MKDAKRAFRFVLFLSVLFSPVLFSGCVRVAGGAGYWHTGKDGQTTAKTAGFDTADYVPGSPSPGKITV